MIGYVGVDTYVVMDLHYDNARRHTLTATRDSESLHLTQYVTWSLTVDPQHKPVHFPEDACLLYLLVSEGCSLVTERAKI